MDPGSSLWIAELGNGNMPPMFKTRMTIKNCYADDLKMWIEMMESNGTSEKMEYELTNAGFQIYRRCDEHARNILDESISAGDLILKGDDTLDPLRKQLVGKGISIIATEAVPQKTSRKVAIWNDIGSCIRNEGEPPS